MRKKWFSCIFQVCKLELFITTTRKYTLLAGNQVDRMKTKCCGSFDWLCGRFYWREGRVRGHPWKFFDFWPPYPLLSRHFAWFWPFKMPPLKILGVFCSRISSLKPKFDMKKPLKIIRKSYHEDEVHVRLYTLISLRKAKFFYRTKNSPD